MIWNANLQGVWKIYIQKWSYTPSACGRPDTAFPMRTMRVFMTASPSYLSRPLPTSDLRTAKPSLHVLSKHIVFHIGFIFLLHTTPPPLTGRLADSDAFYGATTQVCCEQRKIFLSCVWTSIASSHSSDTSTRKSGDVVSEALPCPDTEVMWQKCVRKLQEKWWG